LIGGRVYIKMDLNINIFYTFEQKKCDEEHWIDKIILGQMGPHLDKMNEELNFLELLKNKHLCHQKTPCHQWRFLHMATQGSPWWVLTIMNKKSQLWLQCQ
jgi:hypothetical protein